ncbi:hypothetical protein ACWIVY_09335 [Ursidibacter sp. B-7004-1]
MNTSKNADKMQDVDVKRRKNAEYQKAYREKRKIFANGRKTRLDLILDTYTHTCLGILVAEAEKSGKTKKELIQDLIKAEFERRYPESVETLKKGAEKHDATITKYLTEKKKEKLHGKNE